MANLQVQVRIIKPFTHTMNQLSTKFKEFIKKHSKLSLKEKTGRTTSELADAIRRQPQYQETVKDFTKHLNTLKIILDQFKKKKFKEMLEIEQGKFKKESPQT